MSAKKAEDKSQDQGMGRGGGRGGKIKPNYAKRIRETGNLAKGLRALPHAFVEIDHEIFSAVILLLTDSRKIIVSCESMCTEYWLTT